MTRRPRYDTIRDGADSTFQADESARHLFATRGRGWVYVDGEKISVLGTRVDPESEVRLAKAADNRQNTRMTFLLNKPVGFVSAQAEKDYPNAASLVVPDNFTPTVKIPDVPKLGRLKGLAPAGRLDIDSHGLLVLTQDGRIAKTLIAPDSAIDKEYLVRVEGEISEAKLEKLRHGLTLDGRLLKPAKVQRRGEDNWLKFTLIEGRKRQIRRMCELVDLKVTSLRRIRIGKIKLGKLAKGKWRLMGDHESF